MDVLSLITREDDEKITAFREDCSGFSSEYNGWSKTKNWLTFWANAKNQYLHKIFQSDLIMSKEVEYRMSMTEIAEIIEKEMMGWNSEQKYKIFFDKFVRAFDYLRTTQNDMSCYWAVTSLIGSSNLASNSFHHGCVEPAHFIDIPIPGQEKPFRLQDGAKVSRTIGKLCSLLNIPGWEDVRLKISQILNTSVIHGELCLSIHPLDYLTASVNSNGWNSCMDFYDGEYRRGVIEMMNSSNVIVAYLKSKDKVIEFQDYEWNSKRWREFFIVDRRGIFGIKGYPYWNQDLEKTVISWLRQMVVDNNVFPNINFCDDITTYGLTDTVSMQINNVEKVFHMRHMDINCGPAMYNDFYTPNTYMACFSDALFDEEQYENIFYSGVSECVVCGDDDFSEGDEGEIVCNCCSPRVTCYRCGSHYDEAELYEVNGQYYCSCCYENLPNCDFCGDSFDSDREGEVNLHIFTKKVPSEMSQATLPDLREVCICNRCWNTFLSPKASIYKTNIETDYFFSWWRTQYILLDDITNDGKYAIFGEEDNDLIIQDYAKESAS